MTASVWKPGDVSDISLTNADNTYKGQQFSVNVDGQTVFNITNFAYATNTTSLAVYVNGVRQFPGVDFTESSTTSFTLTTGADLGDLVAAYALVGSPASQAAATSAATAQQAASDASGYSTAASGSATAANTSAGNASNSATLANNRAVDAQNWATKLTTEVIIGQGYSAKQYALNAAQSATDAATSATNAVNSQIQADWTQATTTSKDYIKNKPVAYPATAASNVNESTIANGFATAGQLFINYRGATAAISTYRFCNGMSTGTLSAITASNIDNNGNVTGTATNITGIAAIANGGTGASTATAGLSALGGMPKTGGTFTGAAVLAAGTASAPSLSFTADLDTGLYAIGDGNFGVSCNAVQTWSFSNTVATSYKALVLDTTLQGTSYNSFILTNTNGLNLQLNGGGTTPLKNIRISNGTLEIVNSAYTNVLLQLFDSGALNVFGAFAANSVSGGTVTQTSDENLKENWQKVPADFIYQLAQIDKLGIYRWKDTGEVSCGIGAQSLEKILPSAVIPNDKGIKQVNTGAAAMVMCGELAKLVVTLQEEVRQLKLRMNYGSDDLR